MFDFRYHALSLVGVLVALMVGVLLGIAIGDKGLISSAGENIRRSLRADVRAAQADADRLRTSVHDHQRFESDAYPLLVQGRLSGQRIGVIGVGPLPDAVVSSVRNALKDTGARLTVVASIRQPIALSSMPPDPKPRKRRRAPKPLSESQRVERYGRLVGGGLVRGSGFVQRAAHALLESSSGTLKGLDAVVLAITPTTLSNSDSRVAQLFEAGLADGLSATGVPVVGVETTKALPSQISWFKQHRLTSVDDVDQWPGHVALVFALAGANGAYGIKQTADSLVPRAAGGTGAT